MSDGIKLGQLLCDADIITKRQLSKALAEQVKGRKGTIGEILVEMGFCSFDDITETLMNSAEDTQKHEEKHEEIHKAPIPPPPQVEEPEPVKEEPVEISEEKVLGTKFSMSIQTIIGLVSLISAGVGGYYMLLSEIEEAKQNDPQNVTGCFHRRVWVPFSQPHTLRGRPRPQPVSRGTSWARERGKAWSRRYSMPSTPRLEISHGDLF